MANRAAFPPGDAREDWAILRALSEQLGDKLPYDSLDALRQAMFAAHPHLMRIDQIAPGDAADVAKLAALGWNNGQGSRCARMSATSISPTRSRALPPSWPNVRRWRAGAHKTAAE